MRLRIKTMPTLAAAAAGFTLCLALAACSPNVSAPGVARPAATLTFGAERRLGEIDKNPSTPFLRYSPDGRPIRMETFRGKPLVINFFASWCDPCREEMPLLNALASKAHSNGYSVLGVAIQDSRASLTQFAKEAGILFPIALDLNSRVQRTYRVFGPPATFFIDAQGVVRDVVLGPITPERAREALIKAGVRR